MSARKRPVRVLEQGPAPTDPLLKLRWHLDRHRQTLPRSPFRPERAARVDGWSVFDFGARGWYGMQMTQVGHGPGPCGGMMNQLLGYERSIRAGIRALHGIGRLTRKERDFLLEHLAEERRRHAEQRERAGAVDLLKKLGWTVTPPKEKK